MSYAPTSDKEMFTATVLPSPPFSHTSSTSEQPWLIRLGFNGKKNTICNYYEENNLQPKTSSFSFLTQQKTKIKEEMCETVAEKEVSTYLFSVSVTEIFFIS